MSFLHRVDHNFIFWSLPNIPTSHEHFYRQVRDKKYNFWHYTINMFYGNLSQFGHLAKRTRIYCELAFLSFHKTYTTISQRMMHFVAISIAISIHSIWQIRITLTVLWSLNLCVTRHTKCGYCSPQHIIKN